MMITAISPTASIDRPALVQVGSKALALIDMITAGMPVPPGFVLTVQFFEPWIRALQSTPEWEAVQNAGADNLRQATTTLQAACRDLQFTQDQKEQLESSLASFRASHGVVLLAVRSSSPEEDLESASFAGGYETTLGVTPQNVDIAVRNSFASCFDERVFFYKRERAILTNRPRIAVIVQELVDATSAGVAFSLNPINNCFDEVVINANHGLGESIVAGLADPDAFVVDKLRREIIETHIGSKQVVITLNLEGGTNTSSRSTQQQASLTPAQVLEVTQLVEKVETYYQKPMDIEWAISAGKLFLLQARPITTYLPLPHEMVTAPGEPKRLYANSTLIEQGVQEPLSVLGTDFLAYVLNKVGGPVAEGAIGPDGMTFTAGGGYYMNISYAMMIGMKIAALAPGSFGDPRVMEILDGIDMQQYTSGELPAKLKALRGKMLFKMLPMATSALDAYLRPQHILQQYQAALPKEVERLETFSGDGLSLQAQAVGLAELLQFFYGDYGIPMILAGQIAQRRIKKLFKQETGQVQDHLINLGIALPGNKTAAMGELMYALASSPEISRYDTGAEFVASLDSNRLSPEFVQAWEQFMAEFGMRCPGEIDVATPRPKEQPALFFEQLKNMSLAVTARTTPQAFFDQARAKREAAYQALHEIALKKGRRAARALARYYKTWVILGGYRETPKHYVIKVVDLFRRCALAIAQDLVADGRLDRPEQIFDLTIADIDRTLADRALDLRALARERSALINQIRQSKLVARVIDSRGKIYYPPPRAEVDGELSGIPISPGMARGRVKVFQYASEKRLLPGDILVARATDPGWTPLFINARGIILEIGGALQHGAVVAREYGIPCVSGLDDATDKLKDGQLVEVDGSHGVVRILEEAERP